MKCSHVFVSLETFFFHHSFTWCRISFFSIFIRMNSMQQKNCTQNSVQTNFIYFIQTICSMWFEVLHDSCGLNVFLASTHSKKQAPYSGSDYNVFFCHFPHQDRKTLQEFYLKYLLNRRKHIQLTESNGNKKSVYLYQFHCKLNENRFFSKLKVVQIELFLVNCLQLLLFEDWRWQTQWIC